MIDTSIRLPINARPLAKQMVCLVWLGIAHSFAVSFATESTNPVVGIRDNTPNVYALTDATIVISATKTVSGATLVVKDGIILSVGRDVSPPEGARIKELTGKWIYPGFIDAYSPYSDPSEFATGASHWHPSITPQRSIAKAYKYDPATNKQLRSQGFTARLIAPDRGIIHGKSSLVSTADVEGARAIIAADVAQHMRLTLNRRRGTPAYPNSPMGAVALARQTMFDARWYQQAWRIFDNNPTTERPERNDALASLADDVRTNQLTILEADDQQYFLRAERFAREFNLNVAMLGSGDEYRRLEAIVATGRSIIVPVAFPKPPRVATRAAALNASLEDLMHWQLAPENPAKLVARGIDIAMTTHRLDRVSDFRKKLLLAVRRGLKKEDALRALTTSPARLLRVTSRLGTLEPGKLAHLVVTDGDYFDKGTKILESWVDGSKYEITAPASWDPRGTWQTTVRRRGNDIPIEFVIAGSPTKPNGKARKVDDGKENTSLDNVTVGHLRLSFTLDTSLWNSPGVSRVTLIFSKGKRNAFIGTGKLLWPNGAESNLRLSRSTAAEDKTSPDEETDDDERNNDESGDDASGDARSASSDDDSNTHLENEKPGRTGDSAVDPEFDCPVFYPLGAFGRESSPERHKSIAMTNATVWTCAEDGIIEDATVLIENGKITAVGQNLKVPQQSLVVDATEKHITPGIVDCHSHMATDGGINESGQAVTAEVRIGDFIDATDISIYRQLAGGVTTANILHGSANPIGGQNQVIKLRWGALFEKLKFHEAPAGIKYALGENVKRSNSRTRSSRYPRSRMGVEQIVTDEFHAARQYKARWEQWELDHRGLPPRIDLQLEAIAEILDGKRWIHCHSYRQDEILAFLRVLEQFDVTIGTLQHVLEGYKVADVLEEHGAMASAFSDWWAYKFEVYDAIPYNGALMHDAGVVVSFNSDDRELARHLNHEAAKAVKYGEVSPEEALKFVTLNPARQLRIDQYVGSIEPGKHADLVLWSGPPLSNFSRCQQTWIDGRKYFDRDDDRRLRKRDQMLRRQLVQLALASGQDGAGPAQQRVRIRDLWPRHDEFCHAHDDHDDDDTLGIDSLGNHNDLAR